MIILTFKPRTTTEANQMQQKLDQSTYNGEWNVRLGRFEFIEEEELIEELEYSLSQEITFDIYGHFEMENA